MTMNTPGRSARPGISGPPRLLRCGLILAATALSGAAPAQNNDIYALYDGTTGLTCAYWNLGAKLSWVNSKDKGLWTTKGGGDWLDANGQFMGDAPFKTTQVKKAGRFATIEWGQLASLVQGWVGGAYPGLLLRIVPGGQSNSINFVSKEGKSTQVPLLVLQYTDSQSTSKTVNLKPRADSNIDCSTAYSRGQINTLTLARTSTAVLNATLAFDLPPDIASVTSATLRLTAAAQTGYTDVGVYQLARPDVGKDVVPDPGGIAAQYAGDACIQDSDQVLFVERFNSGFLTQSPWNYTTLPSAWNADVIDSDPDYPQDYPPLDGSAYRVRVNANANYGTSPALTLQQIVLKDPQNPPTPWPPEELYFRYYLRFAPNFRDTADGGKMPGLSGDTSVCGNGGRQCNGTDGWSLRGSFFNATDSKNPIYPRILLGTYAYHADMQTQYGDHWPWQQRGLGLVEQNKWYAIEQYVKLNDPGFRNGVLKAWIDGRLAFQKTDLNLRTVNGLPIDKAWLDIYYGGTGFPGHELRLYIDNLVVAKQYIGPRVPPAPTPPVCKPSP